MKARIANHLGVTPRSLLAGLFGMVVSTLMVVFFEGVEGSHSPTGAQALPLPAMIVIVLLLVLGGVFHLLTRERLLKRAELLCAMFMMFFTVPLASSGFWMMMVGALGSIPKTADFEAYDALAPGLWPHGPNVLADGFHFGGAEITTHGDVRWEEVEYEKGHRAKLPVLHNAHEGDTAWIRITLPLKRDGNQPAAQAVVADEPYLLAVLLKPEKLGSAAYYYCRAYHDQETIFATEAFSARTLGEVTYLHQTGFLRKGMYGLLFPGKVAREIHLEFGLSGRGQVTWADPQLLNVGALDSIYRGRRVLRQSEFAAAGETARTELLVQPDRMLSWAGLKFLLQGGVPWRDWLKPLIIWCTHPLLLLMACFALAVLLRRQWLENERYPMSLMRIPQTLLEINPTRSFPNIFYSRTMWIGFAVTLCWCLLKGWHGLNNDVPNLEIKIQLTPYFTDPTWGDTWHGRDVRNVTFSVTALVLSLAIFMELNVLLSLVLGFFLFRAQYWFGATTGMALIKNFPFPDQQQVGAFVMYALLVLFFSRKTLWRGVRAAFTGDLRAAAGEVMSFRKALLMFLLSIAGLIAWAQYAGLPLAGMLIFFVLLMMIALVSMKLRTECGLPASMFTPVALVQIIPIAGGLFTFGPRGAIFVSMANWIIYKFLFFLLPGFQMELLEMGKRNHVPRQHIRWVMLLGIVGGLAVSGWMFLSMSYGVGGDNFAQRWPFMDKAFLVNDYNLELAKANMTLSHAAGGLGWFRWDSSMWAYLFAAGAMTLLAILRQVFTGFWFHPVGFLVSSTPLMEYVWGSLLAAWIIRALTLKLGGAVTVREKLFPFFVGVFLASIAATILFMLVNIYLFYYHPTTIRGGMDF